MRLPPLSSDSGEVIGSWLLKIIVVMAVVGVLLFDGISCALLRLQTQDAAQSAAIAALDPSGRRAQPDIAFTSAQAQLTDDHPGWVVDQGSLKVGQDGSVTLTVTGKAKTLVTGRIKQLTKYTVDSSTATARQSS